MHFDLVPTILMGILGATCTSPFLWYLDYKRGREVTVTSCIAQLVIAYILTVILVCAAKVILG